MAVGGVRGEKQLDEAKTPTSANQRECQVAARLDALETPHKLIENGFRLHHSRPAGDWQRKFNTIASIIACAHTGSTRSTYSGLEFMQAIEHDEYS
jgi:hypothetical protein